MSAQASRQFDKEGRKKFFTLDMNNILLEWDTFKTFMTLKQCWGTFIYSRNQKFTYTKQKGT